MPRHPATAARPAGPITVVDVAQRAGVSVSTVSRILNGTARVSDDKRRAVEAAVEALQFQPNPSARSLKMGTTMSIGVLVQDIDSPFFTRLLRGIEEGLQGTGYVPIVVSGHWNAVEEAERIRLLMSRRIDGLVLLCGHLPDKAIVEFARQQPISVAGRVLEGPNVQATWLDQVQAGYLATQHLLAMGHRRIAHIAGPADHTDAGLRQKGYVKALEEHGLKPDPALGTRSDFNETGGLMAMNRLLDGGQPFSAVFAANDQSAYGAMMAMHRRGIRVPDDVSVIGIDDLPASAFLTPPLTTVHQPLYEVGRHAACALLRLLGQEVALPEIPALRLALRETTRRV